MSKKPISPTAEKEQKLVDQITLLLRENVGVKATLKQQNEHVIQKFKQVKSLVGELKVIQSPVSKVYLLEQKKEFTGKFFCVLF